jgi:hypothetical protein
LQPEHEAHHSAEGQQPLCAAFAVPASPSAIAAINSITFTVFIVFSFKSGNGFSLADVRPREAIPNRLDSGGFLD